MRTSWVMFECSTGEWGLTESGNAYLMGKALMGNAD